jgi:hypothetical protein
MSELIYKQMAAIMGAVPAIGKDRDNKQQGYKFRGIDEVYNVLHAILAEHKVFPMPEVLSENRGTVQTANGKTMMHTTVTVKYTFYAEDGSNVSCVMIGEGMDMGDKSGNKAVAGAEKYAFVQVFCIPTSDPKDSENDSPEIVAEPPITCEALMTKITDAKAIKHLANIWEKYGPDMAKMSEQERKDLAIMKDSKKVALKAAQDAEREG